MCTYVTHDIVSQDKRDSFIPWHWLNIPFDLQSGKIQVEIYESHIKFLYLACSDSLTFIQYSINMEILAGHNKIHYESCCVDLF